MALWQLGLLGVGHSAYGKWIETAEEEAERIRENVEIWAPRAQALYDELGVRPLEPARMAGKDKWIYDSINLPRELTDQEMQILQRGYGTEFSQWYKFGAAEDLSGGEYWLWRGTDGLVGGPPPESVGQWEWISHTHPVGLDAEGVLYSTYEASKLDIRTLRLVAQEQAKYFASRNLIRDPQITSRIIPEIGDAFGFSGNPWRQYIPLN
jgi:hypothetical protein